MRPSSYYLSRFQARFQARQLIPPKAVPSRDLVRRALHESRRGHRPTTDDGIPEFEQTPRVDPLEFDPELARQVKRYVDPVLRHYFRGEVRGLKNLPERQTLVVANHDGGMLPVDAALFVSTWLDHFCYQRPLYVLVHDVVMTLAGPWKPQMRRLGCLLADRPNLEAALNAGHSLLIYPGGSRETFRSFWDRKTITLGLRTGFVKHALRHKVLISPVASVGAHETLIVLWRGSWLADRLGITRRFRADVFPIVAGLPFGIWLGAGIPHIPLPAKLTMSVLPAIDLHAEVTALLGREPRESDLEDEGLLRRCFDRVRVPLQKELDRLYAERRFPIIG